MNELLIGLVVAIPLIAIFVVGGYYLFRELDKIQRGD